MDTAETTDILDTAEDDGDDGFQSRRTVMRTLRAMALMIRCADQGWETLAVRLEACARELDAAIDQRDAEALSRALAATQDSLAEARQALRQTEIRGPAERPAAKADRKGERQRMRLKRLKVRLKGWLVRSSLLPALIALLLTVLAPAPALAEVYALVVGINSYRGYHSLLGAVDDARDIADAVRSLQPARLVVLLEGDATRGQPGGGPPSVETNRDPQWKIDWHICGILRAVRASIGGNHDPG